MREKKTKRRNSFRFWGRKNSLKNKNKPMINEEVSSPSKLSKNHSDDQLRTFEQVAPISEQVEAVDENATGEEREDSFENVENREAKGIEETEKALSVGSKHSDSDVSVPSSSGSKKSVSFDLSSVEGSKQPQDIEKDVHPEKLTEYYIPGGSTILNAESRFTFNQYELPEGKVSQIKKETESKTTFGKAPLQFVGMKLKQMDLQLAIIMRKFVVLLSRSSGQDKVAAFTQYGSMAVGDLISRYYYFKKFVQGHLDNINLQQVVDLAVNPVDKAKLNIPKELAWWVLLEDSMSQGRKVLRLFKWVKEYERARLAMVIPPEFLTNIKSSAKALFNRILQVLMHVFAAIYYFSDNLIWATQIGIVNRATKDVASFPQMMKKVDTLAEVALVRNKFFERLKLRREAEERVARLTHTRNYASLYRLLFAIIYSSLQIASLATERKRLHKVFGKRLAAAKYLARSPEEEDLSNTILTEHEADLVREAADKRRKVLKSFNSVDGDQVWTNLREKLDLDVEWKDVATETGISVRKMKLQRQARLESNKLEITEQVKDMVAASCNLLMLLNRLKFRYFQRIPLYMVGIFGATSGFLGIMKNWPKKVQNIKIKEKTA
eukprot:augustus_masked-scaffold_15-processed-gene-1.44-mRNA-1 protein AED:1.00 eAED:1.00 QI:0/-1/0/0/-1/1/1/0/607